MSGFSDPLPLARALIGRPSVTPDDAGALGLLEEALTALGFTCRRLAFGADAGRPAIENLYARRAGHGPHICFAGHTDVVPPGQGWTVDPFAAEVRADRLFGRGAADMKGAIACFVAAVARLDAETAAAERPTLSLLITGDEEGRALDGTKRVLAWLAETGETLDYCIVGEPTNPHRLGEMMKIGRRGSLNARLRVLGTQGHVAYPHLADNPIPPLLEMLRSLTAAPLDRGNQHFQPSSLVLTSVDVGNMATNVIPAEARAAFNIRFNDLHSGKSLEDWLRQRLSATGQAFELEVEVSGESFLTPPGPLSEALAAAIEAECGIRPELSTSGGTSDARFIKSACPVVEFGLVGESMHKADEHVRIGDLESLTRIYQASIRRLAAV